MEHHRLLSPDRLWWSGLFSSCMLLKPSANKPLLFVGVGILLFQMLFQQLQRVRISLQALAGDGGEAG